ncbi:MAG: V-type ATP synthase subunit E [Oscillospiraceae bacterium]|nr:V-type ATP synthase subunit E [Oscillospiraceae bacterium]
MNGIEKVAARIVSDAQQEAALRKQETEARAVQLRAQADAEAEELRRRLLAEGEAAAEKRFSLLVSSAETENRKRTLGAKQELLSAAFARAVELLRALDRDKYVKLLAALAVRASETGTEQIILNPEDRAAFGEEIAAEANRLSGKSLTLSQETRPIVGGLILSQGRIEVNCALDTLAELRRSELSAEAARMLFS